MKMQPWLGSRLLLLLLLPLTALPDTQSLGSEDQALMGSRGPVVVIVGAGISGIAAAEKLHKSGLKNVKILEATGRTGGRIHTQSFEDENALT
ncbi:uncharacterized protein LOC130282301 [Hyla sarda]|uniref:uncharacterized protein LOC130282301 n=1 Tax=Hyla sarda TaxID=327740 RepID=UPI0024C4424C|nr:uncharacterized protein LOC130282301 [Hyla sarda]